MLPISHLFVLWIPYEDYRRCRLNTVHERNESSYVDC